MSFFGKFKLAFEKLFGHAPDWVHFGQTAVAFAAPAALAAIAIIAPELLPVATPIIAEVKADLATVSVLVGEGTASPSLGSALDRLQANLPALLTSTHVKDDKTTALVTLAVGELQALKGMLPSSAAPIAPAAAS